MSMYRLISNYHTYFSIIRPGGTFESCCRYVAVSHSLLNVTLQSMYKSINNSLIIEEGLRFKFNIFYIRLRVFTLSKYYGRHYIHSRNRLNVDLIKRIYYTIDRETCNKVGKEIYLTRQFTQSCFLSSVNHHIYFVVRDVSLM